jgi:hypothetical protein
MPIPPEAYYHLDAIDRCVAKLSAADLDAAPPDVAARLARIRELNAELRVVLARIEKAERGERVD